MRSGPATPKAVVAPKAEVQRVHAKVYAGMTQLVASRGGAEGGGDGARVGETPEGLEDSDGLLMGHESQCEDIG